MDILEKLARETSKDIELITGLSKIMTVEQAINQEWRNHYVALSKKYDALKGEMEILNKDLETCRLVNEQYKAKIENLEQENSDLRKEAGLSPWIN